jgi:ABC-type enterochelin transport system substrate-binding protein
LLTLPFVATELATLQSNTTLVSTCAIIAAAEKTANTCDDMEELQQLVTLAANETKLADKAKNNATKISALQAKASEASVKLTSLEANATLTSACSSIKTAKEAAKAGKSNSTGM